MCGGEWWAAVSFFFVRVLDDGVFFCFFSGRGRSGVNAAAISKAVPYFFCYVAKIRNSLSLVIPAVADTQQTLVERNTILGTCRLFA